MAKDKKGKSTEKPKEAVTNDPRFSSVHSDPRFNLPSRKKNRVQLDDRFKAALADNDDFKQKVTVDKYGRKVKQDKVDRELKKYANLEAEKEDDEDANEKGGGKEKESDSDSSSGDDDEEEESQMKKSIDRARGEGVSDQSESSDDDESSSSSDDSESSDEEESEGQEDIYEDTTQKEDIPTGGETSKIACVNMDWDNVRAVDLMATFSSFVPPRGRILSVKIYPSEYGKEQLKKEEQHGPAPEFFEKKKKKSDSSDSEDEDEEITAKSIIQEDKGEEVDSSTLRKYQLQRLRYYYAIITCDSVNAAKSIYDNCDGTEYESTANFFDLRYVPEDMTFDDVDEPRDQCDKIPSDYKPNSFVTDALQHSKVKLTWDETPAERMKLSEKAFSQKDIDDMDFKAYIASDSEEDEDNGNGEDLREKYRSLLGNMFDKGKVGKDDEPEDVEITFTPGLDDAGGEEDSNEKDEGEDESTIDKYKRKEKERKQRRLERMKERKAQEGEEEGEGEKKDETTSVSGKKAQRKAEAEARAKKAAELELLMMDDNLTSADVEREKRASEKNKMKKGKKNSKKDEVEAEVNSSDPRFQAMFENPEFAVDPTAPQYKKTEHMDKLMEERRRRYKAEDPEDDSKKSRKKRKTQERSNNDDDVNTLVQKLKRQAKK